MGLDQCLHRESPEAEDAVIVWRKANQIHAWFIKKLGLDPDFNAERSEPFGREVLEELSRECERAINNPAAANILPTQKGFFFGPTDYDEWYMQGLKQTISDIEGLLKEDPEDATYSYDCWW